MSYIINTIDLDQHNTRFDGYEIRRTAVENNVTLFTSLETVKVLLDVLEEITLSVSTIDASNFDFMRHLRHIPCPLRTGHTFGMPRPTQTHDAPHLPA